MNQHIPTYGINALNCGVRGDGISDDAPAIQRLIDAGTPVIYFPAGHYLIGSTLRLPSNTRLHANRLARFQLADGAGRDVESFLLCNADPHNGNENISVRGGIWDGNTRGNPRGEESDRNAYTGVMINFRNVRGLTLTDMRLKNSSSYHTRLSGIQDFRIERVRFEDTMQAANQDGVHIAGCCEDGIIRDITAVGESCTGDDLVALNADDALDRSETRGKLGGPIRRLRISGLRTDDCHSFVRMASVWSTIEDIEINNIRGGCRVNVINADALRFCLSPLFRADDQHYAGGAGLLRHIRVRNVQVYKSAVGKAPLFRLDERMQDFEVEGFRRMLEYDIAPAAPTVQLAYVPAEGIVLEGIDQPALERLKDASSCTRLACATLPYSESGTATYRVEAATSEHGHFLCWCPRFDSFRVAASRLDQLPEPDWMVAKGQYSPPF